MLIVEVLGGIGIFLLGMMLLTEGLQDAAASQLQAVIGRVTGNRLRGTTVGAALTLVVQSSTATTLATIGFVSAGLLTFQQAVPVIVGANIGTTSTGWVVALLGLKVQIIAFALPLVAAGALLRMLAHGRLRAVGVMLAGFGLIFVGIDLLQDGMVELAEDADLGGLDGEHVLSRAALVGIGFVLTVVMQSSTASMVTTLTAVHAGVIGLPAAAALIVGQNIGTTPTGVVASLGGTVAARRTAMAHVLFNVITAAVVFLLLPLLPPLARRAGLENDPALVLAGFHTLFSVLGAFLILPLLGPFTALIERLVPERRESLTRYLKQTVPGMPAVAVDAARRTVLGATADALSASGRALRDGSDVPPRALVEATAALRETRSYLVTVISEGEAEHIHARHLSVLHAIDHAQRLILVLQGASHAGTINAVPELKAVAGPLGAALLDASRWCAEGAEAGAALVADGEPRETAVEQKLADLAAVLDEQRLTYRGVTLQQTARGICTPDDALLRLDAMLYLERLGHHGWRCVHHLGRHPDPEHEVTV